MIEKKVMLNGIEISLKVEFDPNGENPVLSFIGFTEEIEELLINTTEPILEVWEGLALLKTDEIIRKLGKPAE